MAKYRAVTRFKRDGIRYMPGQTVTGITADEAQPYIDSGAIEKGAGVDADELETGGAGTAPPDPFAGVRITPAARTKMEAAGVSGTALAGVKPSGQNDTYTAEDVEAVLKARDL